MNMIINNIPVESDQNLNNLGDIDTDCYITFTIDEGVCLVYRFNRYNRTGRVDHLSAGDINGTVISGNDILNIIDAISIELGCVYNDLNDVSVVFIESLGHVSDLEIPLAWLSIFKNGRTWYENHGYRVIPENLDEYEFRKQNLLNEHADMMQFFIDGEDYQDFVEELDKLKRTDPNVIFVNEAINKMRKYYGNNHGQEFDWHECEDDVDHVSDQGYDTESTISDSDFY